MFSSRQDASSGRPPRITSRSGGASRYPGLVVQPIARVGPYDLIRPLGAGGMAETFVAVRRGPEGFQQTVCLKRILQGHTAEPSFIELFLDEARLLAQLRCAGIVQVYDFGAADGTYYMALELIDGADMDALIGSLAKRDMRLPPEVALYIATQLLVALDYAHSVVVDGHPLNIVHRDISPSNILLSMHGEVKLTDFGIAKSRGRKHKTQTGHTKGKVAYMSPEQVRGEELDARSDLFAVGVLLYEMLTGTHPFYAPTDLTLLNNILSGKRRALLELLPEASPPVVALVDALLQVEAGNRPASAGDALRAMAGQEQAFVLQRKLATLMVEYRAATPPRATSATPAPAPSDGGTAILPPGKTPADRVAFAQTKDLEPGRAGSDSARSSHLLRDTSRELHVTGQPKKMRWLWAVGVLLLLVALLGAGLSLRGKPSDTAPAARVASPAPTADDLTTTGSGPRVAPVVPQIQPDAPAPRQPGVPAPEETSPEETSPEETPSPTKPTLLHAPNEPTRALSGSERVRGSRRAKTSVSTPAPLGSRRTEPTHNGTEVKNPKARSGVPVSTDDF